jgi:hypothetical protein
LAGGNLAIVIVSLGKGAGKGAEDRGVVCASAFAAHIAAASIGNIDQPNVGLDQPNLGDAKQSLRRFFSQPAFLIAMARLPSRRGAAPAAERSLIAI